MKTRERLDRVLQAAHERTQQEVGSLIGAEFLLTANDSEIVSKEFFFDQPLGKQVFAKMDIVGDLEGKGGLLISIKDAIRLGGTLIMLPPAELDDVVANEAYDGETEDSYGEIANIIAGSYTKTLEELFPKACRFIRKEQEVLVPVKVDIASDEPIPNGRYYQVSCGMQLDGKKLGNLIMLIPAEPFGLVPAENEDEQGAAAEETEKGSDQNHSQVSALSAEETGGAAVVEDSDADSARAEVQKESSEGQQKDVVEKHKKLIDSLLETCRGKVEEEVGSLLGVEISCTGLDNRIIGKEDFFFEEVSGKQVVADLDVVADLGDTGYLVVDLKDAIRIGSTLIMLPAKELETAVAEEDFGADCQDAYGEIANIIAGVYTAVFEEQYKKPIRFIKKDIKEIVPMKVDIESDEPIVDQAYYISQMSLAMDGHAYGKLQLLFPAAMFGLESLAASADENPSVTEERSSATADSGDGQKAMEQAYQRSGDASAGGKNKDILIISDSEHDLQQITDVIERYGYTRMVLSFRDSVNEYLPGSFKMVFVVSRVVDEQLFGMAIKVSTACTLPVIAAGPQWTRTKVIKAVKYGVTDILLTPAEKGDIEDKLEKNRVEKAA